MSRPNTIEEWLPDAARYANAKFRSRMTEAQWEWCEGEYHILVAKNAPNFDPAKGRAFTRLCGLWRFAFNHHVRREFQAHGLPRHHLDVLDNHPVSWDALQESAREANGYIRMKEEEEPEV